MGKSANLIRRSMIHSFIIIHSKINHLSLQDEGLRGTVLSIAQATKARPKQGTVIAQVRWITKSDTMNPREVDVPGPLVNYVIVAPKEYHWHSGTIEYDPRIPYKIIPPTTQKLLEGFLLSKTSLKEHEKVIARRILLELIRLFITKRGPVLVNLGIGIPALISLVAAEEDLTQFTITVLESGPWGGLALSGNLHLQFPGSNFKMLYKVYKGSVGKKKYF